MSTPPSSANSITEDDNALKRKQPSGSKGALRSKVWLEFTRSEDKLSATCNHCKENFRVNGTSSLQNHLRRCPKKKVTGQPTSITRKDEGTPSNKIKFCQERSRKDLVVDQVGISTKEEICYDCPTRWNSTYEMIYEMIATSLVYEEAFKRLQKKDEDFKTNPSTEEWELAREICKCLQIFYVSTMDLSGMDYPTADLYFPHVCEIHIALIEWKSSAIEVVRKMADSMFEKFKKYWSSTCLILAVAFVLNPGCKLKFVENYYSLIYGGFDSALQTKKVREAMIDIYSEYSPPATNPLTASQPSSSSSSQQQIILPNPLSSSKFIRFESWYQVEGIGTTQCKSDLDNYLEEPLYPLKDVSLLDWWKVNTPKYPTLSKMARDILCIPVTSVPSESAFSIGGRVLSDHRASLDPKMVQALVCTQNWLPSLSGNASTCSVSDDLMANDELNDVDDDYCSTIGISP